MKSHRTTLLFHDTFLMRGGAERMNLLIADILDADIATAYVSETGFDPRESGRKVWITDRGFRRGGFGFLRMKWSFFQSEFVKEYDRIIFSNEAITAIRNVKPGTKTFYYAHSISRHLFDQRWQYFHRAKWYEKPFFLVLSFLLRKLYISDVRRADMIFTNSVANQRRIKEWIGRDAIVLSPPVDTDEFHPFSLEEFSGDSESRSGGHMLPFKSYYISFSRLTHAKRVDRIIEVAQQLPDVHFLILYGREDSQKDEFIALGKGFANIHFLTLDDNTELPRYIAGAIASIAVSREEDFGMVAIESMACGVPVIAVDEGGYRESILHGVTGMLIPTQDGDFRSEDLHRTIEKMTPEHALTQKDACVKRAKEFSLDSFRDKLREAL